MKICIVDMYKIKGKKGYYCKEKGNNFTFVSDIRLATDLTKEKAKDIMYNDDWYLKQYNASEMIMEE